MAHKNFIQESRDKNWGVETSGSLSSEQLNLGCMLRIANAADMLNQNITNLMGERDTYKRRYESEREAHLKTTKTKNTYRATINRLEKRIKVLEKQPA